MPARSGSVLHHLALLALLSLIGGLLAAGIALPAVGGLGLAARDAANSFNSLPSDLIVPPLQQHSVMRAADGSVIAVLRGPEDRVAVSLTAVPMVMRQAIVAIEDDRFYENAGLDLRGILRAALRNEQAGTITQGGSTLTQQYVKNVLIQQEGSAAATADTISRKLAEARYAVALERRLTKAQILERYLNIAYFGEGVYGVATAASHYFAEPVTALNLPQSALLAGLVEDPVGYDPVAHPGLALERRNTVLARMGQLHYISAAAAAAAERTPLDVHPQNHAEDPCVGTIAPFFCSAVLAQLLADPALGATQAARDNAVFEGGLDITTTLDPQVQLAAQQAVDSVVPRTNRAVDPIAMVRPGTGAVLAMAVNRTYGSARSGTTDTKYPLVTQPFAQPGSSFKLFTLVAALEQGVPLSYTLYAPPCYISKIFSNPVGGGPTCPLGYHNADPTEAGRFALPQATWYSVNTYFVQLEERVGLAPIRVAATELGIPAALVANTGGSLTLGGLPYGVSPLQMATAYAAIAAHGLYCPSTFVTSITGPSGAPVAFTSPGPCQQVVPAGVADTITAILQGVIDQPGGTGDPNAQIGRPAAGKTGTNGNFLSAWFVGYTPQLAAAVAMADPRGDQPQYALRNLCVPSGCVPQVYGGTLPALIWAKAMSAALAGVPPIPFSAPPVSVPAPNEPLVPNVLGMPVSAATAALSAAGYQASVGGTVTDPSVPAGDVAATSPTADSPDPPGSTVTLVLSSGTAPGSSASPSAGPGSPGPGPASPGPPASPSAAPSPPPPSPPGKGHHH